MTRIHPFIRSLLAALLAPACGDNSTATGFTGATEAVITTTSAGDPSTGVVDTETGAAPTTGDTSTDDPSTGPVGDPGDTSTGDASSGDTGVAATSSGDTGAGDTGTTGAPGDTSTGDTSGGGQGGGEGACPCYQRRAARTHPPAVAHPPRQEQVQQRPALLGRRVDPPEQEPRMSVLAICDEAAVPRRREGDVAGRQRQEARRVVDELGLRAHRRSRVASACVVGVARGSDGSSIGL